MYRWWLVFKFKQIGLMEDSTLVGKLSGDGDFIQYPAIFDIFDKLIPLIYSQYKLQQAAIILFLCSALEISNGHLVRLWMSK